jgi:enoyl-CoA hydratase/carnithine racemase
LGEDGRSAGRDRLKNGILVSHNDILIGRGGPTQMADDRVRLEIDGPVATITNDNPDKHNAFDDAMDVALFDILGELKQRRDVRAVIWRAEGKSFSSGRDVAAIGGGQVELSHHELMKRGHRGILQVLELEAPIIVAMKGWSIGGSFQRALVCDIRVAAEGARMMLPEVGYGVIPDTGGIGRLYQICGHGVVSDMVLTGRPMSAEEALHHGIVSRVVPEDQLDATVREMADKIAAAPQVTVNMARRVIRHLSEPSLRSSMEDELVYQTFISRSDDMAEMRQARAEDRAPRYTGS